MKQVMLVAMLVSLSFFSLKMCAADKKSAERDVAVCREIGKTVKKNKETVSLLKQLAHMQNQTIEFQAKQIEQLEQRLAALEKNK